jgi:endoglucanase Acf2
MLGINLLPVAGHSFYLGRYKEIVDRYYNFMIIKNNGEHEKMWQDIIWKWQALYAATNALGKFEANPNYGVEAGTT